MSTSFASVFCKKSQKSGRLAWPALFAETVFTWKKKADIPAAINGGIKEL